MLVKKKNGQIRVCFDFRDLNKACPKDSFPLPLRDILLDQVVSFQMISFMDRFSGYNLIQMHPQDEDKTSFTIHFGSFVMSYALWAEKCSNATYLF